jgi:D-beta-D-heptose 7-phosphate kinase / D-beta-D-heptose 1-phosphate adenosyltransferase
MAPYTSSAGLVDRFRGLRVTVVGDAIVDRFADCAPRRLCAEAPVPVVQRRGEVCAPGGAANVAANLAALGARVRLAALVGPDAAGAWLRADLEARGVDVEALLTDASCRTQQKTRIIAEGQYLVRVDEGETAPGRSLREAAEAALAGADGVVLSDYALGVLDAGLIRRLAARRPAGPLVVDTKRLASFRRVRPTAVTPNLDEAAALSGGPRDPETMARRVRRETDAELVLLTMGPAGVHLLAGDGAGELVPARPVRVESEVGAGDSFVAALALALAAGADPGLAAGAAVEAAGIAVAKRYTAVVHAAELSRALGTSDAGGRQGTPEASALSALQPALEDRRRRGQRLVFTNGVFDLLHAGHVDFLRRARRHGDALIVAVNSDAGARRLKGPGRPVVAERERVAMLAALDCVDHVLAFDAGTAAGLLRRIRPHVYVKGGDHSEDGLPEAETARQVGARIVILDRTLPASTTSLIRRVHQVATRATAFPPPLAGEG